MPTITFAQRNAELDHHNATLLIRIESETSTSSTIADTGKLAKGTTAGGDERRLRGIPVVGAKGVGGVIPGTRPGANLR